MITQHKTNEKNNLNKIMIKVQNKIKTPLHTPTKDPAEYVHTQYKLSILNKIILLQLKLDFKVADIIFTSEISIGQETLL